jgi:hypothetical protein
MASPADDDATGRGDRLVGDCVAAIRASRAHKVATEPQLLRSIPQRSPTTTAIGGNEQAGRVATGTVPPSDPMVNVEKLYLPEGW